MALIALAYWYWFAVWHPWKWGYSLQKQLVVPPSGGHSVSRYKLLKVPDVQATHVSGPEVRAS